MCWICNASDARAFAATEPFPPQQMGPIAGSGGAYLPNLTAAQGAATVLSGSSWQGAITYSIPRAGAAWSGYGPSGEPSNPGYSVLSDAQAGRFRAAMAQWDELIARPLTEVSDATPGQIRVAFIDAGSAWGYAYYPTQFNSVGGDIWIDSSNTSSSFASGSYDHLALMHEIGHALGLKHSFDGPATLPAAIDTYRASIMSYTGPVDGLVPTIAVDGAGIRSTYESVNFRTPSLYDIAAVQQIYGADTGTRAGASTYTWAEAQPFFEVIYDAGGTDTFDLSGHARGSVINLNEGAYSSIAAFSRAAQIEASVTQFGETWRAFITSTYNDPGIYTWTDNLAIAFGVTIENANLGWGHDLLQGNGANNVVNGNAGFDTLYGGGGNDTLAGGTGNDQIFGELGNDVIDGGIGADTLAGGPGDDFYIIDTSLDIITELAGQGIDTVSTSLAFHQLDAGLTLEYLTYTGAGPGTLFGNALNNILTGNNQGNSFNGFAGADYMIGGSGNDYFYIDAADTLVAGAGYDAVFIQTVTGTAVNLADAQAEYIVGWTGNDTLDGSGAIVSLALLGGAGADVIRGGWANDYLYIDSIDTVVDAGAGTNDVIVVTGAVGINLNITAARGEYIIGGSGADTLNGAGSASSIVIQGGGGADSITGGLGNDYFYGDAGADVFRVTANAQFDAIFDFVDAGGLDDDRIDVRALGAGFDTIGEILAATTDHGGTSVVNFGAGNALYLYLIAKTSLTADDFIF